MSSITFTTSLRAAAELCTTTRPNEVNKPRARDHQAKRLTTRSFTSVNAISVRRSFQQPAFKWAGTTSSQNKKNAYPRRRTSIAISSSSSLSYVLTPINKGGRAVVKRLSVPEGSMVLGREESDEIDVVIPSRVVSGTHAKLDVVDGTLYVTDLGSTNGTFVGGERIPPGVPREVEGGAQLCFGPLEEPTAVCLLAVAPPPASRQAGAPAAQAPSTSAARAPAPPQTSQEEPKARSKKLSLAEQVNAAFEEKLMEVEQAEAEAEEEEEEAFEETGINGVYDQALEQQYATAQLAEMSGEEYQYDPAELQAEEETEAMLEAEVFDVDTEGAVVDDFYETSRNDPVYSSSVPAPTQLDVSASARGGTAITRSSSGIVPVGNDTSLSQGENSGRGEVEQAGVFGTLGGALKGLGSAIFNSDIKVNYQYKPVVQINTGGKPMGPAEAKSALLVAIAGTDRGARVNNEARLKVEQLARQLESQNPTRSPLQSPLMNGRWALQYTTNANVVGGNRLFKPSGPIHQTVDIFNLQTLNEETYAPLPFFKWKSASSSKLKAKSNSRVEVEETKFRVGNFDVPAPPTTPARKALEWEKAASGQSAMAWMDTTYLDGDLRISRSHTGDLYILTRDDPNDDPASSM